ncbi:hypothetical protein DR64_409 [Paraburkholderia xenovorans LB400]|jgi:hypothetical protein|uniref:DUF2783 domain-containing protein n=1 Tax=Paraburkholderia xenovorans (strain LB400) TaxID=266265 RepID=Q140K1_PARXL|nr:hypothetical protein [Paraburkholderia xenovorans]ABE30238.1 Hypothetical protein Bxe_A2726 [Paraburkholderia xenovorans LB400]AIP33455.1 hypothetical protein DR64_409 [Paraburkholderia xenovorans LB400]
MTDIELDAVYTRLCKTMTDVGETNASLFLARFALLAITRLGEADAVLNLIAEAGEGMGGGVATATA